MYMDKDLTSLHELLKAKKVTSKELIKEALEKSKENSIWS